MKVKNNGMVYFSYNSNGYVYSRETNNLFQVSDLAEEYFYNPSIIDNKQSEDISQLTNELEVLSKKISKEISHEIYIANNLMTVVNENNLKQYCENQLIICEFSHEYDDIQKFLNHHDLLKKENPKLKFLIKTDINFRFDNDIVKQILEHGVDLMYFSNFLSFNSFIQQYHVRGRIYIELKLSSIKELEEFKQMILPKNIFIMLVSNDVNVSNKIINYIDNKLTEYINDQSVNISNIMNIVRLLKYNLGQKQNGSKKFLHIKNTNINNTNEKCISCWANKICHSSRLFSIYNESPNLTILNSNNCNHIRYLIISYFKLSISFKENIIKNRVPKYINSDKYKIKLINP